MQVQRLLLRWGIEKLPRVHLGLVREIHCLGKGTSQEFIEAERSRIQNSILQLGSCTFQFSSEWSIRLLLLQFQKEVRLWLWLSYYQMCIQKARSFDCMLHLSVHIFLTTPKRKTILQDNWCFLSALLSIPWHLNLCPSLLKLRKLESVGHLCRRLSLE